MKRAMERIKGIRVKRTAVSLIVLALLGIKAITIAPITGRKTIRERG
jgi:hypothetical protein